MSLRTYTKRFVIARNGSSIASEVVALIQQNVPKKRELLRRKKTFEQLAVLRRTAPLAPGPFPGAEEMLREDRER